MHNRLMVGALVALSLFSVAPAWAQELGQDEVTLKNGRRAAKGKCPVCGTTVMRILGK